MWAPLPPEPPAPGWWVERQAAELVAWAGAVDDQVRARRAAAAEREARAGRVRLGSVMRTCHERGHPSCGAYGHGPCVHPALADGRATAPARPVDPAWAAYLRGEY